MRILLLVLAAPAALAALASLSCESRNIADSVITSEVKRKLLMDNETGAVNINVDTNGGVVTLTGVVLNQADKAQAEQIAANTAGVTRVVNNITVTSKPTGPTGEGIAAEDLIILSKINARYVAEGIAGAHVDVKGGVVTLSGSVEDAQYRFRAESIARATGGVKDVNNMIVVRQ